MRRSLWIWISCGFRAAGPTQTKVARVGECAPLMTWLRNGCLLSDALFLAGLICFRICLIHSFIVLANDFVSFVFHECGIFCFRAVVADWRANRPTLAGCSLKWQIKLGGICFNHVYTKDWICWPNCISCFQLDSTTASTKNVVTSHKLDSMQEQWIEVRSNVELNLHVLSVDQTVNTRVISGLNTPSINVHLRSGVQLIYSYVWSSWLWK